MRPRTERYSPVFDNRIVDPANFQSYPYGYTNVPLEDVDMENVEALMDL